MKARIVSKRYDHTVPTIGVTWDTTNAIYELGINQADYDKIEIEPTEDEIDGHIDDQWEDIATVE